MEIKSAVFLGFVLAVLVAYHAVRTPAWRRWVLFAANAVFFACLGRSLSALLPMLVFIAAGYAFILLARTIKKPWLANLEVAAVLVLFFYLKQYVIIRFIPSLPFVFTVVGLSYILFRVLHLIVDVSSGALDERVSPVSYFNYVCSFLTFVSGPIQTYQEYDAGVRGAGDADLSQEQIAAVFSRLLDGYLKIVFLSSISLALHKEALKASADAGPALFVALYVAACAIYTLYVYFNFSGYMDIVVGVGRLFGFTLPENFDRPFTSETLLDFWSRWHITLSNWFKIYMFNPLVKKMINYRAERRLVPYYGVIAYFATFLLIGFWHGSIGVGIFFGVGVSLNKLYENKMSERLGKKRFRKLEKHPLYAYAGRGFTFGYISLSLICLWMGSAEFWAFALRTGAPRLGAILAGLSAAAAAAMLCADITLRLWTATRRVLPAALTSSFATLLLMAVKVILLAFFVVHELAITPDFVYKVF